MTPDLINLIYNYESIVSECFAAELNNFIMFCRSVKTNKNGHSSRRRRVDLAENAEDEWFPFSNKELQSKNMGDDILNVKKFRSRAQLSRKKCECIPLLSNMRMPAEKLSIVKSSNHEYNIFLKAHPLRGFTDNGVIINGGMRELSPDTRRRREKEWMRQTNSSLLRPLPDPIINYQTVYPVLNNLYISGETKCIAPSRASFRRNSVEIDFHVLKM
jgi:hypothetical protein